MLGPLKFGLQSPVPTVKSAAAPGRFALTLSLEGDTFNTVMIFGPKGATAYIDWGDGTNSSIGLTGLTYTKINHSCGSTATISGSNLIDGLFFKQLSSGSIVGITGTYPTSLVRFIVGFNYADPVFTPPNVVTLDFVGSSGPTSLTTGSKLISLGDVPPNLTSLDLRASTKLASLPTLPVGLTVLRTPPGITVLPALPDTLTNLDTAVSTKLTTINLSGCTKIRFFNYSLFGSLQTLDISNCRLLTDITKIFTKGSDPTQYRITAPSLTTLRIDGSGLTYLDLTGTNVTTLNIPPSMDTQLKTVAFGSKLKPSGLFRFEIPEDGKWTLY